ncbi:MAG: hypothetical protein HXO78_09960 [Selenomonas sp.]|nr:hypothetical protein [Selenomonas sp.]
MKDCKKERHIYGKQKIMRLKAMVRYLAGQEILASLLDPFDCEQFRQKIFYKTIDNAIIMNYNVFNKQSNGFL